MKNAVQMTRYLLSALLCFCTLLVSEKLCGQMQTIVFMRHGEKPKPASSEQLSCQGLNRSLALPKVLARKFRRPDYIFAPSTIYDSSPQGGDLSYNRPLTTIEPTAISLGMSVNIDFAFNQDQLLANELLQEKYHSSLIFLAWEHHNIVNISELLFQALGENPQKVPDWKGDDFDSLYIFHINWQDGKGHLKFKKDSEKLDNLSEECPYSINEPILANQIDARTFYLIPNAEDGGRGQLNCQGLNRALALPIFLASQSPSGSLDSLIAPSPYTSFVKHDGLDFYDFRGLMTIDSAAIQQKHGLYTPYATTELSAMIAALLAGAFPGKTFAIAWDIADLDLLARALLRGLGGDVRLIPEFVNDHDVIFKISVGQSSAPKFSIIRQNIRPSELCP